MFLFLTRTYLCINTAPTFLIVVNYKVLSLLSQARFLFYLSIFILSSTLSSLNYNFRH